MQPALEEQESQSPSPALPVKTRWPQFSIDVLQTPTDPRLSVLQQPDPPALTNSAQRRPGTPPYTPSLQWRPAYSPRFQPGETLPTVKTTRSRASPTALPRERTQNTSTRMQSTPEPAVDER